jgi:hypothetical protein
MKNIILFITLMVSVLHINAQDGYTYTLSDNGNYSYTISAVSNFDSGAFSPITESYGFVVVLPDGITISVTEYLPTGTTGILTPIDGANVIGLDPNMADNDLYLITTTTNAGTLASHTNDTVIPLVTLTVIGNPTSGEISLLSNDSTLANTIGTSLDSFMQVDIIDDNNVVFDNRIVGNAGLSDATAFDFSTLSTNELETVEFSIYPNPTSDIIHIITTSEIDNIELFDVTGKRVLSKSQTNEIKVNHLPIGVYLLKVYSARGSFTKKVVIN